MSKKFIFISIYKIAYLTTYVLYLYYYDEYDEKDNINIYLFIIFFL